MCFVVLHVEDCFHLFIVTHHRRSKSFTVSHNTIFFFAFSDLEARPWQYNPYFGKLHTINLLLCFDYRKLLKLTF